MILYTGAYTEPGMGNARGIGQLDFDLDNGTFGSELGVTDAQNPSYLALSADGRCLYAVDERTDGGVSAYRRDPDSGALSYLNSQSTGGRIPVISVSIRVGVFCSS